MLVFLFYFVIIDKSTYIFSLFIMKGLMTVKIWTERKAMSRGRWDQKYWAKKYSLGWKDGRRLDRGEKMEGGSKRLIYHIQK